MSDKRRTFAVIDGNSLMHRAFHAVPPTMNAPDGRPTNAIFGFLNMFLKMIDALTPTVWSWRLTRASRAYAWRCCRSIRSSVRPWIPICTRSFR